MLLLKHGSMWLVIFLLLGVRSNDSADIPELKQEKTDSEEEIEGRGSGGDEREGELLQFQADSGGYRNNSDPTLQVQVQEKVEDGLNINETAGTDVDVAASKVEQTTVESSTHQEEMTFGEEFEDEDESKIPPDLDESKSVDREEQSGSSVYEIVAEESVTPEAEVFSNTQPDFSHDIGTEESNHEGYNEDAILYFESKRYKGLKKKNPGNSKIREMSNSITENSNSDKERVHITSYVADITEVDGKNNKEDVKVTPKFPPRDATTISTFFIAPKDSVSHRTPVRIRKKIIKPIRLGYRKKQNQTPPDSQGVFRQKVRLFEPPSHSNKLETGNREPVNTESTTTIFTDYREVNDHTEIPDERSYLSLRPIHMVADGGPYIPPPLVEVETHMSQTPEQYLRDEMAKFKIKDNFSAVLPTALAPESSSEIEHSRPNIQPEDHIPPIGFLKYTDHTLGSNYRLRNKQIGYANFITSNKEKDQTREKQNDFDTVTEHNDGLISNEEKDISDKSNFEETNKAEDGLTSSDTILAPIQAAVSLSNHVQAEGKKKSVSNTIIEQQEIRVEPVLKTTIEIQKSIPFEIREVKPEYNQMSNFNNEYEKPDETVGRPGVYHNDFLQQVALAYHKLSNGDYQTNIQIPQVTTHQPQPQNLVYFYRNRVPQQPLYLFPFYNKGNDFNKGHVGQYIMQQSYKNLGFESQTRPIHYQGLKYQTLFPSLTRPLPYSNFYDFTSPVIYQSNVPVISQNNFGFHKTQVPIRTPELEQSPNQHLSTIRGNTEEVSALHNDEELEAPSTEVNTDTTEEIKQGSEVHLHEAKQEILQETPTEQPPLTQILSQPLQHHHQKYISQHPTIPNNQPYPYGYSFVYPISTTDFRSQNPYLNYNRRGKAPPFRPSHPMYTSQYPPHTYLVASSLPERGIHARSINNKKLCIEYGGFKPPLVPSIQIDEEFEKEAQDKSSKDE